MSNNERSRNLLIASAITIAFAFSVLLIFHPSGSPLGSFFDVFVVLIVTHNMALAFGGLVLVLRIFKVIQNNSLLFYLLAGTLNLFLAIVGITLFFSDQANMEWLHKSIANLFVGFLIFADCFVFRSEVKR